MSYSYCLGHDSLNGRDLEAFLVHIGRGDRPSRTRAIVDALRLLFDHFALVSLPEGDDGVGIVVFLG